MSYTSVSWTSGDVISESKLDSMIANDREPDAMYQGIEFTERAAPSTPGANKVHVYAKDKGGVPTVYAINDAGTDYELSEGRPTFVVGSVPGTIETGSLVVPPIIVHRTLTIVKAYAYLDTPPTGQAAIFDINKNGTSIWASTQGNRVQVAAAANLGTQTSFDTTTLSDEDVLTLDIDQVGSGAAGADLVVELRCK